MALQMLHHVDGRVLGSTDSELKIREAVSCRMSRVLRSRTLKRIHEGHGEHQAGGLSVRGQNHYEVPFHASQNGCDPKVYKQ